MLYRKWLIVALLLAFATRQVSANPHANFGIYRKGQTRIMPMGDSITFGGQHGWRLDLQDLLRQDGYTFRMVGGNEEPRVDEKYFSYHAGFGGWTIGSFPRSEEFGGGDADWAGSRPDLVLLMIGTNDMQWGNFQGADERLGNLLDRMWEAAPNAIVLVAQIIPVRPGFHVSDDAKRDLIGPHLREFNDGIPAVVAKRVAAGRKAMVVDLYSPFDPTRDLADNVHPNAAGAQTIAQTWMRAIKSITFKDDYPPYNLPPIVSATIVGKGRAATISPGDSLRLEGSVDDDDHKPARRVLSFKWSKVLGPGNVSLQSDDQRVTDARFEAAGSYCLAFTASDGELTSSPALVRVVVNKPGGGDDVAAAAPGKVIGINIGSSIKPDDAAGVIPRPHWNPVPLTKFPAIRVTAKNLVDGTGVPTGASFTIKGNNFGPDSNPNMPDTPDGRMLGQRFGGTNGAELIVNGIPFTHYDLYVYFAYSSKDQEEEDFVHSFIVRDPSADRTVAGPFYARNMPTFSTWTRLCTTQETDQNTGTPPANYLLLSDLSLADVEVVAGAPGDAWAEKGASHSTVCGMQIVERKSSATGARR